MFLPVNMRSFRVNFFAIYLNYIALLSFVALSSCSEIISTDILYESKTRLVVSGVLIAGEPIRNIYVTRTFSPFDSLSTRSARLTTANVSIEIDGRVIPLVRQQVIRQGFPSPADTLFSFFEAPHVIAEAGKTYTLHIIWQGLKAEVITVVPRMRSIDSIGFVRNTEGWNINLFLPMTNAEAVQWQFVRFSDVQDRIILTDTRNIVVTPAMIASNQSSRLVQLLTPSSYIGSSNIIREPRRIRGTMALCDRAFVDYYDSRPATDNLQEDGVMYLFYQQSTQRTNWNVRGDGIGIVVGQIRIPFDAIVP
jgi:hypothetical protein